MLIQNETIVEMRNITKRFGGLVALDTVSLSVKRGEIHALVGENGAGKSTLMRILSGACGKDQGDIIINGDIVNIENPKQGLELGISVIYQEFTLAKDLTVAENIFIDHLGGKNKHIVNWKKLRKNAGDLLKQLGFDDINVMQPVSQLSVALQQVVEIAKALSRDSNILILDEPTAVLTTSETEKLFKIINGLKKKGVAIVYISHRLKEIFEICDRITVLKDGRNVDTTMLTSNINENRLVTMMIGRSLNEYFPKRNVSMGKEIFRVEGICNGNMVRDISFSVKAGEILGVCGLVGAGRTETFRTVFGADRKESGNVYIFDKKADIKSPRHALKYGLGMLPEDRKNHGVLIDMPIRINATLSNIKNYTGFAGYIKEKKEIEDVEALVEKIKVKTENIENKVSTLSGGNQQKVAFMKWLASNSKILILDEPTRGIDVGSKVEIYNVINQLAEEGVAIVLISSEMTEIIGMCDRAIVMRLGSVVGELSKEEFSEYNLIKYAMGVNLNEN